MNRGFTLVELLVTMAVLGLLAGTAVAGSGRDQAHLELEVALRRLRIGLDRGRLAAERQQQPCGLHLSSSGWQAPSDAALPACPAVTPLAETGASAISLRSNLPPLVRFTANGLLLDGGVVVLAHPRLPQRPCLVIGLPLGITRSGTYQAPIEERLSATHCRPDDAA